jgi:diguanylate cyclase (GGDEF)-like protein
VNQYFLDLQNQLVERYTLLAVHYSHEPKIQNAFRQENRVDLHRYLEADYQALRAREPHLFVMHFFYPNNHTLLRMHKPESYGDDLTNYRPIVAAANHSRQLLTGFEVGKNGTTYRISMPLFDLDQQHYGLLEFGIQPAYFVNGMTQRFGVESLVLVKDSAMDKLRVEHNYPVFESYRIVQQSAIFEQILSKVEMDFPYHRIDFEGKSYLVVNDLLLNAFDGKEMARVLVAKDISSLLVQKRWALIHQNLVNVSVLVFLLLMIYFMFGRYSRDLQNSLQTIEDLNNTNLLLKSQAMTDGLTGIHNRRFFDERMKEYMNANSQGCLLLFDIDHFKKFNDTYGHQEGDDVLIEFAKMLKHFFRRDDLIARWGGEEFAVYMTHLSLELAMAKADHFRDYVANESQTALQHPFTVSCGVTCLKPGQSYESLFENADRYLYQAKQEGRNLVRGGQ